MSDRRVVSRVGQLGAVARRVRSDSRSISRTVRRQPSEKALICQLAAILAAAGVVVVSPFAAAAWGYDPDWLAVRRCASRRPSPGPCDPCGPGERPARRPGRGRVPCRLRERVAEAVRRESPDWVFATGHEHHPAAVPQPEEAASVGSPVVRVKIATMGDARRNLLYGAPTPPVPATAHGAHRCLPWKPPSHSIEDFPVRSALTVETLPVEP